MIFSHIIYIFWTFISYVYRNVFFHGGRHICLHTNATWWLSNYGWPTMSKLRKILLSDCLSRLWPYRVEISLCISKERKYIFSNCCLPWYWVKKYWCELKFSIQTVLARCVCGCGYYIYSVAQLFGHYVYKLVVILILIWYTSEYTF